MPTPFKQRVAVALKDPYLRATLARSTGILRRDRLAAFPTPADFAALQAAAQAVRRRTLLNLPALLEQLEAQVVGSGGVVFWAEDAAAANAYIAGLVQGSGSTGSGEQRHRFSRVLKSGSVLSQEIGLVAALEAAGAQVVDLQLGDYIAQLAGEPPSHPVFPIIHKRKEDVSALLQEKLDLPETIDVQVMASMARFRLRRAALSAQIGVVEATLAVAETGALALATTSGHDRLMSALPPVLVVLMAMTDVAPTLADLALLTTALEHSAAGPATFRSLSLLRGPARPGEGDGPQQLHLVIVDNGRSELLATGYGEALACIRCGACLNACPVYQTIGGQAYGGAPAGPIGAVVLPLLPAPPPASPPSAKAAPKLPRMARHTAPSADLPHASTLCGACAEVCPVGIDLPRLLVQMRSDQHRSGRAATGPQRSLRLWLWAAGDVSRYRRLGRIAAAAGALLARPGVRRLPLPWAGWMTSRDLPAPARRTFHDRWEERQRRG